MSKIASVDAQLQSATFTVGAGYSGVIEDQLVDEGDYIKAGDALFELRSPTLADAIRNDEIARTSLLYSTTEDGKIKISAAANGVIQKVNYREGAFVPANSEIAIVNSENALYVNATFKLAPPDYVKVRNGNEVSVLLPDNTRVTGRVYGITLESTDDQVYTTVKVKINQQKINSEVFSVGTPVEATLYLDTKTWYSRITEKLGELTN